jgi:hypothetical protein
MSTTLEELDTRADDVPAGSGYAAKELKNLPDGDYQFEVTGASLAPTKNGQQLFKMELEVIDGNSAGTVVDVPHFLTNDKGPNDVAIGILRKDLKTLGFDEENWKKEAGRPFSKELVKASATLCGMRFKGKKVTNKGGYANLYVNERIATDGKPAKIGAAELNASADTQAPFKV